MSTDQPYREPQFPTIVGSVTPDARTLCRLLADPKKVRVGVRRHYTEWVVFITPRSCPTRGYMGMHAKVERAMIDALMKAEEAGLDGVDLSMGRAFPHPFGRIVDRDGEADARQLAHDVALLLEGELS